MGHGSRIDGIYRRDSSDSLGKSEERQESLSDAWLSVGKDQ